MVAEVAIVKLGTFLCWCGCRILKYRKIEIKTITVMILAGMVLIISVCDEVTLNLRITKSLKILQFILVAVELLKVCLYSGFSPCWGRIFVCKVIEIVKTKNIMVLTDVVLFILLYVSALYIRASNF